MENGENNWTENRLQGFCFQWHWRMFPQCRGLLFKVNNNSTDAVKGAIEKATGRIPGVSDLIYLHAGKAYFIEMKVADGTGSQSKAQEHWQLLVEANGFDYALCDNTEDFQRIILEIHSLKKILPF